MTTCTQHPAGQAAGEFYLAAMSSLDRAGIPYLIGGAFAFARYTGIERSTKDMDVFLRRADVCRALAMFEDAGYRTELTFPHWLGKVHCGDAFIDLIFSSGNGVAKVDDAWFEHAVDADVLGRRVRLMPAEEMIWSKAYVQERERYDGADVLHLMRQAGPDLHWTRLLTRFGGHWRVLLSFVVLFGFVYPGQRHRIPAWVTDELLERLRTEPIPHPESGIAGHAATSPVCNGTLISREQYLFDLEHVGDQDPRVEPLGPMTKDELEIWTAAITGRPSDR